MVHRVSLEPTAALVIDLAQKFYNEDPVTRNFIEYLDISSGKTMIDAYKNAGIYEITQELISNRKFIIREAVLEAIKENISPTQVVILAAGKAPLALELLVREKHKIAGIYEVDISLLEDKKSIYQKIIPQLSDKITFVQADLNSENLMADLEHQGFNTNLYTVIVLEGITHYMSPKQLEVTLGRFASSNGTMHRVIIDFGPPYHDLTERIQPLAREAYRIIEDECYLQPMTKYDIAELTKIFQNAGGNVLKHYTICDIEKMRTGKNICFPEQNSGWLEYVVAHI